MVTEKTMLKNLHMAITTFLLMSTLSDGVEAKDKNPPGCKNSSPSAHNPNCSGGSGTHTPATPDQPAVEINTVTHSNSSGSVAPAPAPVPTNTNTTVSVPSGGSGSTPQAAGAGGSDLNSNTISGSLGNQGNDKPVGNAGGATSTPTLFIPASTSPSNTATSSGSGAALSTEGGGSTASSTAVSGASSGSRVSNTDHGDMLFGHNPNIVPEDPLYSPDIVRHLSAEPGGGSTGNTGINLPSRIEQIAPTDITDGQYAAPVSGLGHEDGNTFGQTGGLGYKFVHVQQLNGYPRFDSHVPPKPGKNYVPGYRAVLVSRDGTSYCVMSGMGRRTIINQNGLAISVGHAETLHFRSSSTAHLPSNHQMASHCLVSIRKDIR